MPLSSFRTFTDTDAHCISCGKGLANKQRDPQNTVG